MSDHKKRVGILNYGTSNLHSINNALLFLGYKTNIVNNYQDIENLDSLILPGVGSYPVAMKEIKKKEFDKAILDFNLKSKQIIGICLGFQLLFDYSSEFEHTNGLGLIKGNICSFSEIGLQSPLISWLKNRTNNNNNSNLSDLINSKFFYFVHSYFAKTNDEKIILSYSQNNQFEFLSGIETKNIFGFQFHPEKSGLDGIKLLNSLI